MAGMLHLPRTDLLGRISDAIGKHEQVLVTGRAGTGKSVLARLAAQDKHARRDRNRVSLTERSWRTLADVEPNCMSGWRQPWRLRPPQVPGSC